MPKRIAKDRSRTSSRIYRRRLIAWALTGSMLAGMCPQGIVAGTVQPEYAVAESASVERGSVKRAARTATAPQSPRIVSDSSMESGQRVTYDCVWFGSYPQTEVVAEWDTETIDALESRADYYEIEYEEIEDSEWRSIISASYDSHGDAVVEGVKYRRVKQGDAMCYGSSEAYYNWPDGTSYHYFRYEPIKWRVLSVDGQGAFLLADKGLDNQMYNETRTDVTWETSTVRSWLNGYGALENACGTDYSRKGSRNFFDAAFSGAEQSAITETDVVNGDNPVYGTEGGNNTKDKIFLLSESEAWGSGAEKYGFTASSETYDEARQAKSTTYAKAMGVWSTYDSSQGLDYECRGNTWWWLRSPGSASYTASDVNTHGWGNINGSYVYYNDYAVRPALHLNLSSVGVWKDAGVVYSDGTADEKGAPDVIYTPMPTPTITPTAAPPELTVTPPESTVTPPESAEIITGSVPTRTPTPTKTPTMTPTATPVPYRYPKDAADGFKVGMNYVSDGWLEQLWCDFQNVDDPANVVEVKGDGTYEVSYTALTDVADILMIILSTDLKNNTFSDDFNITATKLTVGGTDYALNTEEGNLMFADGNVEDGCLRYNVRNPYNEKVYRSRITEDEDENCILDADGNKIKCDNILDSNGDPEVVEVKAGDKITVSFDVLGADEPIEPTPGATTLPRATTGTAIAPGTVSPSASPKPSGKTDDDLLSPNLKVSSMKKVYSKKPFDLDVSTESGGDLHFSSSNKKVAVISSDGMIYMKGYGTTKIIVWQEADEEYRSASKTVKLTVLVPQVKLRKKHCAPGSRSMGVSWKKVPKAAGYEVSVSMNRKFGNNTVTSRKKKTSVVVTVKQNRRKYYIRVRAYAKAGGNRVYGAWSKVLGGRPA